MRYVYFIQQGRRGPIKIGVASDPQERLATLQVASPRRLRLRRMIPTSKPDVVERDLHDQFWHLHLNGEWFAPSDDLERFIEFGTPAESREARIRRAFEAPHPENVVHITALQALRDDL